MSATRRDFLRLAGALGAAGALSSCTSTPKRDPGPKPTATPPPTGEPALGGLDYLRATATPTICFGCTTHCGVVGWVQDGRVRKIDGNPLDPNSQGTVCSKADGMVACTNNPERLLYPLKRVGERGEGRWKRITWDEALAEIGGRLKALREAGTPEQFVFHYGRDKTKGFTKRFTNAYGTPHRLNRRSICSSNRRVPLMSMYGRDFEWETQDFENSKLIINWGANPMEAYQGGLNMIKRIMDAKVDKGARVVTFEVRPSATASISDEFYTVRPASDGAIALAMAHVILREGLENKAFWERWANVPLDRVRERVKAYTPEFAEQESGVPAADITRLAIEFAKAAPACCTLSNRGSAKHYNGVQADRAIRMLDVLVGNVGKPGGFCLSSLRMWSGHYGQEGLPKIQQPGPKVPKPKPWRPGTREFQTLPKDVQERVAAFPEFWQSKYFGELATPSEYPLSWHWYDMRVGQLVYPYIKEQRAKVGLYMSYTLGASYGYPEAKVAREVLRDESLIPFHVCIDIAMSEQAQLADIVLPDATALERWDAHSTNAYNLVPYTGIRQPLVEPAGEARPVQIMLRDLARVIGGGMEAFFDFEDLEDFYREWYSKLPISWEELKRRGIWSPEDREKDYELYERELTEEELKDSVVEEATGRIMKVIKGQATAIGIEIDGKSLRGFPTPTRRIQVQDDIFPLAAKHTGLPMDDINARDLADYAPVPEHVGLADGDMILTTFKWNVHTQGRSSDWDYQAEVVHTNQAFIAPETAARLKVEDGDEVEITVRRPKQHTYRAGEDEPVGVFRNRVKVLRGVHPRVIACSHHGGHWGHGAVARGEALVGNPAGGAGLGGDADRLPDGRGMSAAKRRARRVWWSKAKGGPGNGVALNDNLPINPTPLVGGQSWFDNVCQVRKV